VSWGKYVGRGIKGHGCPWSLAMGSGGFVTGGNQTKDPNSNKGKKKKTSTGYWGILSLGMKKTGRHGGANPVWWRVGGRLGPKSFPPHMVKKTKM